MTTDPTTPKFADPAISRYVRRADEMLSWVEVRLKATGHRDQAKDVRKTVWPALSALRQMALTEKVPRQIFHDHVAFVRDSLDGLEVRRKSAAHIARKASEWLNQFDDGPDGDGGEI